MRKRRELLEERGYRYNSDRMAYVNRAERKAFSGEWIEDHSIEELEAELAKTVANGEWEFVTNGPLTPHVRDALLAELDGR